MGFLEVFSTVIVATTATPVDSSLMTFLLSSTAE